MQTGSLSFEWTNSNRGHALQRQHVTWARADSFLETKLTCPVLNEALSDRILSKYWPMVTRIWGERPWSIDSSAWLVSWCNNVTTLRSRHVRNDAMHSHDFCKRTFEEQDMLKLGCERDSFRTETSCISLMRNINQFWALAIVSIKFEANKDAPSLLPLEPTKSKIVRSSSAVRLINFENGDRLLMMEEMSACSRQSRREKFSVSLRAAESAGDADADASGAGTVTVCRAKFEFFRCEEI